LDLRFNEVANHMQIAPLETDHAVTKENPRGARTIPTPMPPAKKPRR
jgi:hypothetical protein